MEPSRQQDRSRTSLVRISIAALMVVICLVLAGCGEHAEPLDIDGPANWLRPATTGK